MTTARSEARRAMTEFRAPAAELARFRLRVVVAAVFVLVCFGLLAARFHHLQVKRHDYFLTRAEDNRIALLPVVPHRGTIVEPAGGGAGAQLRHLHDRDHALAGAQPRRHARRARRPAAARRARPPPLPQALRGEPQLRERAAAQPAHRRGGRARGVAALPPPRGGREGPPAARLPAGQHCLARDRLHRPHHRARRRTHRGGRQRGQLSRHPAHGQGRTRAVLRARAARHHRLRAGRGQRRRARGARAVAHRGDPGQRPRADPRHRAAEGGREGLRRSPRRPGGDRALDRRRARAGLDADLRPQPLRRRHLDPGLEGAQRLARPSDAAPRDLLHLPARLHLQALHGARRPRDRQAHREAGHVRHRLLPVRRPPLHGRQDRRPRHGRPAQVDRGVVQHLLLPARQRPRHRGHRRLHGALRLRRAHRHRPARRGHRRPAFAGVEAPALQEARAAALVCRRDDLGRHRPGLQRLHAAAARQRARRAGEPRQAVPAPRGQVRRRCAHRRAARGRARAPAPDPAARSAPEGGARRHGGR